MLTVTTAEQRFEFLLLGTPIIRDDALEGITTRVLGVGLSHNIGKTPISIAQQLDRRGSVTTECEICDPENPDPGTGGGGAACGAGGPGSTSCSVTSGGNSCSVACAAGYYACCNGVAGSTNCRCVKS